MPAERGRAGAWMATAAGAALAALAILFILQPFVPNLPGAGLDPSWIAVLGEAAVKGARSGVDLVFTYGPASALVTLYGGSDYVERTLPLVVALGLVYGAATGGLVAAVPGRRGPIPALAVIAVATTLSHCGRDTFLILLPLLVMLLDLRDGGRWVSRTVVLACAIAVGIAGLSKMTLPLTAAVVLGLGDALALARRRLPVLLPGFAIGFLAGEILYGQNLADLATFIRMQSEVASGYSDAMSLDGPKWQVVPWLVMAGALVLATAGIGRDRAEALGVPLALLATFFMLLKAGFVRHDHHAFIAFTGLWLCAAILGATWLLPNRRAAGRTAIAIAFAGLLVIDPVITVRSGPHTGRLAAFMRSVLPDDPSPQLVGLAEIVRSPGGFAARLDNARRDAWAETAEEHPLPHLDGPVDVIPSIQTELIAAGLDYRPRPSFQEYSTYTAGLISANRRFLEGPEAPTWILFGLPLPGAALTIDGRFPAFAEGALWPDLIRRYRPERQIGGLVALKRRERPLPEILSPPRVLQARFGDDVAIDGTPPLFARIVVRPTSIGRLAALLFHPPILTLTVAGADGLPRHFRFLPALGEAGFVLSPLVGNAVDFTLLAEGRADRLAAKTIRSVRIEPPDHAGLFYAPDMTLELSELSVPRDDDAPLPTGSAWDNLVAALPAPLSRDALPVATPSVTAVPTLGLDHLEIGYGVEGDAADPDASLCFAVENADGRGTILWRRCVDHARDASARLNRLALPLRPGTTEVLLKTSCPAGCEGLAAFWAKASPDQATAP